MAWRQRRWLDSWKSRGLAGLLVGRAGGRFALAVLLGAVAGLFSTAFWNAIAAVSDLLTYRVAALWDAALPLPFPWLSWRFLFPALGALAATLLARFLFATPQRLGVASVMLDARKQWGRIPLRYVPATFVNGVLTIGFGGSAGREAPVVAMGGSLGAWVARALKLAPAQRRILVASGVAAAIAAAFNAPLAGVFFALEILLGDFAVATLAPIMLAAVAGTVVCRATEGSEAAAHFQVPAYHLVSGWEIIFYAGLGLLAGVVGHVFIKAMETAEHSFARLPVAWWVRPTLGGLGVGIISLALPGVLGNGYDWTIAACSGRLEWHLLLFLLGGKIVATALTLGSGGWGGDLAPTLFVGAMLGGAYGTGLSALLGSEVASSGAYAMVGMGAVLASAIRCPLTAILLLFELTSSYQVILPIMVAVATSSFVARRLSRFGLYHRRLQELGVPVSEAPGEPSLARLAVADIMDPQVVTVFEHTPLAELLR
ncbi:MAG: chloride channel protein, partial [Thermoanaerobaculum sp.]